MSDEVMTMENRRDFRNSSGGLLPADVPPPIYRTLVEEPVDLQRLATSVSTLVSVGLRVPANWARKKFGIPAPDDNEEVLAPDRSNRTNGSYGTTTDGKVGG